MRRLATLLVVVLAVVLAPEASRAQNASTPFGFEGRDVTSPDGVGYMIYSGDVPSCGGLDDLDR